jgi:DNA transposition AAA+ family ATPase
MVQQVLALSQETKKAIKAKIQGYLANKNISQNRFSQLSEISTANISNILNDKWEKISDDIWNKADKTADHEDNTVVVSLQAKTQWKTIKAKGLTSIEQVCFDAQENKRMLAVVGETGYGKTTALCFYKKEYPKGCYYVLCDELMNQRQFLQAIADELGVEAGGDKKTVLSTIVAHLLSQPQPLLILDDCGKLNDNCLRLIRLIYDKTVDAVGIVLSGTMYFKNYIDKKVRKDTMGFRELNRRIEYWQVIDKPEDKVIEVICSQNGITQQDCVDYIKTFHAANFGKLKSCITNAQRLMKKEPMSLELLKRIR